MTGQEENFLLKRKVRRDTARGLIVSIMLTLGLMFLLATGRRDRTFEPDFTAGLSPQPLVMKGGDPYIRALMRTISASESNVEKPYSVLYGGEEIEDLSLHPDLCITIVTGPNEGDCTTAAGRYQFLTTTWYEKAYLYHPQPSGMWWWKSYSFKPEYQDAVVYAWLSDPEAWGEDIGQLLREGQVNRVLQLLSGTWTSLGYGIETNSMSDYLPEIYQKLLKEELGDRA